MNSRIKQAHGPNIKVCVAEVYQFNEAYLLYYVQKYN